MLHLQMNAQKQTKYFLITAFFLTFIANFPYEIKLNSTASKREDPELKTILLWTSKFSDKTFGLRYK